MKTHDGLPVAGYRPQSDDAIGTVNVNKELEERLLQRMDVMQQRNDLYDPRWLALARTQIEQGFMALNRAVFKPARVKLPRD